MKILLDKILKYKSLDIDKEINYQKFIDYSITHHSTVIKGSTLSYNELVCYLDENISPGGKKMEELHMSKDHMDALTFVRETAKEKKEFSEELVKNIAVLVMKNTGSTINSIGGTFDSSKGELRTVNVWAGQTRFVAFEKVPELFRNLSTELSEELKREDSTEIKINLAFDAHFNFVTLHPFGDGNGRTSRLIMNYILLYNNLPPSIIFNEDKNLYYDALQETRSKQDISIFRKFMLGQYEKHLSNELEKFDRSSKQLKKRSKGLSLLF